jgi:hypothetical protein
MDKSLPSVAAMRLSSHAARNSETKPSTSPTLRRDGVGSGDAMDAIHHVGRVSSTF